MPPVYDNSTNISMFGVPGPCRNLGGPHYAATESHKNASGERPMPISYRMASPNFTILGCPHPIATQAVASGAPPPALGPCAAAGPHGE